MSTSTPVTADQLFRMPSDGYRYELIAGELKKMTPAGWKHGKAVMRLGGLVDRHVRENDLGDLFGAETGFVLARNPDTVRAPDLAFIAKQHLPAEAPQEAYWPGAPDLAVEVVSPSDTMSEIDEKARAWLAAGTTAVWGVNPEWRIVTIYRPAKNIETLTENDELCGGDALPGFRCAVRDIFAV